MYTIMYIATTYMVFCCYCSFVLDNDSVLNLCVLVHNECTRSECTRSKLQMLFEMFMIRKFSGIIYILILCK